VTLNRSSSRYPRRRFLTVGSLGVVGLWAGVSDQVCARTVRGLVAETSRSVLSPVYTPDPDGWSSDTITAAWLGHSTVLINFYGVTILTDPALYRRIGADLRFGTVGPKRLTAAALGPRDLPKIDVVLLSHAHMDHLDPATLRALPGQPQTITAHATLDLLHGTPLTEPTSLRWGETKRLRTAKGDLEVEAFEVKHWGARWRYDTYRGYNGYVISREDKKIIFGGDTAFTGSFRRLKTEGPYELAIMPIGAYDPWIFSHCSPEQAVEMAEQAGARHLLPIHYKTFAFGREGVVEPLCRLEAAIEPERIGWREIGQTFELS